MVISAGRITFQKEVGNKLRRLNPDLPSVIISPNDLMLQTSKIQPEAKTVVITVVARNKHFTYKIAQSRSNRGDDGDFQNRYIVNIIASINRNRNVRLNQQSS